MCNLYSMTKGQAAILAVVRATSDRTGNLPPLPGIYPDYAAPIVRQTKGVRELVMARWGMPSSRKAIIDAASRRADKLRAKGQEVDFDELLRDEPDGGTTNVRNTSSAHWKPWLAPEHRCLVPFTAFSEPSRDDAGKYRPIWFRLAGDDPEPLAFFAGLHLPGWEGVRKIKTGRETADLFAFLTTEPNAEVGAVHPKAMPVILTEPTQWETWLNAPWNDAVKLQRPLADRSLYRWETD